MNYIYRLSGANGFQTHKSLRNLRAHGLEAVFPATHPKMVEYLALHPGVQSLYIPVGVGRPELINGEDCFALRQYSCGFTLISGLVTRMLTTRNGWSKK